jgi:hypothetical protein
MGLMFGLLKVANKYEDSHNQTLRRLAVLYRDLANSFPRLTKMLPEKLLNLSVLRTTSVVSDLSCEFVCEIILIVVLVIVVGVCIAYTFGFCSIVVPVIVEYWEPISIAICGTVCG